MNRYELIQLVAAAIEDAEANDARYEDLAIAAIDVVLEVAAKVCEDLEVRKWHLWKEHYDMLDQGASDGAGLCAELIRALKGNVND